MNRNLNLSKVSVTIAIAANFRLIPEPIAAAIAYGLNKSNRNVLVYDLGGGTFDVSILSIRNGQEFNVEGKSGVSDLGGDDFDNNLRAYLETEAKKQLHRKYILAADRRQLQIVAERTKRELSKGVKSEVREVIAGQPFTCKITRACFEKMNDYLFSKTIDCVNDALNDAKLNKRDIHDIPYIITKAIIITRVHNNYL